MMSKQELISLRKPRQRKADEFRIYERSFDGNKQFDYVKHKGPKRIVHIDPEVVYRMASLGLDRKMVGYYFGISDAKFSQLCEEYPEINEVYLMGASQGMAKAAMSLEKQVENGSPIPTIFRMKIGGAIEADKRKENLEQQAPPVQIFLPDNGRNDE